MGIFVLKFKYLCIINNLSYSNTKCNNIEHTIYQIKVKKVLKTLLCNIYIEYRG